MEKADLDRLYAQCIPFQDCDMYRSGELAENLLARKVLLELLNPEGLPKLKKTLAVLEQTYSEEAEQAARYYFACGVRSAEEKDKKETVFDL